MACYFRMGDDVSIYCAILEEAAVVLKNIHLLEQFQQLIHARGKDKIVRRFAVST